MNTAIATIGHNKPPSDLELLGEKLTLDYVSLIREAEQCVAIVAQAPQVFNEENEAVFATDHIKKMQVLFKDTEAARALEKQPFWDKGVYVDDFFKKIKNELNAAVTKLNVPLTVWLSQKAEAERKEREEEAKQLESAKISALAEASVVGTAAPEVAKQVLEQAIDVANAAEVATARAAAPVNSMASTSGNFSRGALQDIWVAEITNMQDINLNALRAYFTLPELEKVIARAVKKGVRQLDGVKIYSRKSTAVK